ncbi:hypothetical protein KRZ98_02010 [Sphingobium sp. AS12]|uniref:hypothetical protein n=1 Tax=Sphingobium sp. AS12 TaxID=2849495 RepID=UPI001C31785E|nr:hypothetical protein [Sphingobium sp. AS12]MBV2147066.1 hypothetical protein [Sphingobium sp. AS12]
MSDKSIQERFIREISLNLLGSQSVFKPSHYGMGREPADLVWAAGRCVAIMYMTSGKDSFEEKRRHNHVQMHEWIRNWQTGQVLHGPKTALGYGDVDYIVGISIVGGFQSGSMIDDTQVKYGESNHRFGNRKLYACATISDSVFLRLSKRSVGIRDIIHFFDYLRGRGDMVSDDDAVSWIDHWEQAQAAQARNCFGPILPSSESLNEAWQQTRMLFHSIRTQPIGEGHVNHGLTLDLSMGDAVWLSVAERSLALQIASPGEKGPVLIGSSRAVSVYNLNVLIAAQTKFIPNNAVYFQKPGITMISSLDFGAENPVRMFFIGGNSFGTGIYNALDEFRQQMAV